MRINILEEAKPIIESLELGMSRGDHNVKSDITFISLLTAGRHLEKNAKVVQVVQVIISLKGKIRNSLLDT